jgi:hypothetical protein
MHNPAMHGTNIKLKCMVIVNADRIENPVYRNFKKIPFTENVTGP